VLPVPVVTLVLAVVAVLGVLAVALLAGLAVGTSVRECGRGGNDQRKAQQEQREDAIHRDSFVQIETRRSAPATWIGDLEAALERRERSELAARSG
jgi:hypothetical protein